MGLAAAGNASMAWDEFARNSLHQQAAVRPDQWLGVWTSSDTVDRDGMPGKWTWAFPALCTHRHAWPLVSFPRLAGLEPTPNGVRFRPALPRHLGAYSYAAGGHAASWDGATQWRGSYEARVPGAWRVEVDLSLVLPRGTAVAASVVAVGGEDASGAVRPVERSGVVGAQMVLRAPAPTRRVEWRIVSVASK